MRRVSSCLGKYSSICQKLLLESGSVRAKIMRVHANLNPKHWPFQDRNSYLYSENLIPTWVSKQCLNATYGMSVYRI
jgi:hypothetical protein